jgi:hypothetical protein
MLQVWCFSIVSFNISLGSPLRQVSYVSLDLQSLVFFILRLCVSANYTPPDHIT